MRVPQDQAALRSQPCPAGIQEPMREALTLCRDEVHRNGLSSSSEEEHLRYEPGTRHALVDRVLQLHMSHDVHGH